MLNAASCKLCCMLLLWSMVELVYSNVDTYSPELDDDYPWFQGNNIHQANVLEDDFLRKRTKPSLSIVNPLDVLRQRLLLEIARRHMKENTRQVELNRAILKNVGKRRFHPTSIMDFILQQMYNKRWPDVDNYQLNQPHQYQYQYEFQPQQRQMPTKGQLMKLTNAYADDAYDPESFNNLLNTWLINNMIFHLHRHNPLLRNDMKNNSTDNLRQSLSSTTTTAAAMKDMDRRRRHASQSKMLKADHIPNTVVEALIINPLSNLNSDATTTTTTTAVRNIYSNPELNLTPVDDFYHKQTLHNNFLKK